MKINVPQNVLIIIILIMVFCVMPSIFKRWRPIQFLVLALPGTLFLQFLVVRISKIDFRGGEPPRNIYYYKSISMSSASKRLYYNYHRFSLLNNSLPNCSYSFIEDGNIDFKNAKMKDYGRSNLGHWHPYDCNAVLNVAIVIPYRDRMEQLSFFSNYIHTFLRTQNLYYKIFVADQQDSLDFNRGALMNVGARQAIAEGFDCLIFHDVDLIPLNIMNLYACLDSPRHLSAAIDRYKNLLPYEAIMGGAVAILTKQYLKMNGHSNRYYKWGCEDDDLYRRLQLNQFELLRFPNEISRYHMLMHKKQEPNKDRLKIYYDNEGRFQYDGLNSLTCKVLEIRNHWLYQQVYVKLNESES